MTCKKKTHTHKYMTYEVYKMYEGGHILKRVVYDLLRIEYNISRKKDFEKKKGGTWLIKIVQNGKERIVTAITVFC